MSTFQKKSFNAPEETRTPPHTKMEVVKLGDMSVAKVTYAPGWKWSEHIKPVAGTESCQVAHFAYVISGHLHIVMSDGTEAELGPGDITITPPGHNAWVIGDEACVLLDFQGASRNV